MEKDYIVKLAYKTKNVWKSVTCIGLDRYCNISLNYVFQKSTDRLVSVFFLCTEKGGFCTNMHKYVDYAMIK